MRIGWRTGDSWAPKLVGTRALCVEGEQFIDRINYFRAPRRRFDCGQKPANER
jgi:hypothetical protein